MLEVSESHRLFENVSQSRCVRMFAMGALRDGDDLELLTAYTHDIPNSFAHENPCHRGYVGNRSALGISFVFSHDAILLHSPIVTAEGDCAPKGNTVN